MGAQVTFLKIKFSLTPSFFRWGNCSPERLGGIPKSHSYPTAKLGPDPTPSEPNVSCSPSSLALGEKIGVIFFEGYICSMWMGKNLNNKPPPKILVELRSGEGWSPGC